MLESLFVQWANEPLRQCLPLSANGSNRRYFRMTSEHCRCIGALGEELRENEAFVYLSNYFRDKGLRVPEVYSFDSSHEGYLQQDLGDTTLYSFAYDRRRDGKGFDASLLELYKRVVRDLTVFQTSGDSLDYTMCYPRSDFDRQSMQWDLNYFKYYFVKLAHITFDEQMLEDDYQRLMDYLLQEDCSFFMYRDFQSRNIMLTESLEPYYIDFQGGRRGPAQYDLASLIYSAKSDIPEVIRQELLNYYMQCMEPHLHDRGIDDVSFRNRFYGFALLRIMQAMGAYGYRGYYERKEHFLKSIPLAIANLRQILLSHPLPIALPHLMQVFDAIIRSDAFDSYNAPSIADHLTVTVCSFSYKEGMPHDPYGNGGGHVFDCRALPNPGRYEQYRNYTGLDQCVKDFFYDHAESIEHFLDNAYAVVKQSIECYNERHFAHLMVCFGCTGGQHRSVYCAEQMAQRLRQSIPDVCVDVHHLQQEKRGKR